MKKLFNVHRWTHPVPKTRSTYRFVFVNGGSKQAAAKKFARQKNTFVIAIDCEEELEKCRALHLRLGIPQFSLGERDSLATLSQSASETIQEIVNRVSSMLAREGCGASPLAGCLAAHQLVDSEEFNGCIEHLIAESIKCTGGRLQCYEVLILSSYGGGVGAGTCIPIARKMQAALASMDIPVKIILDVLGAQTFVGISPLSGMNAAATLWDLMFLAIDKSHREYNRMAIHVHLSELPPLGQDTEARTLLMLLDEEAVRSAEMQEHLIRIAPNLATSGLMGNVISREAEFFEPLDAEEHVLPAVAVHLVECLKQAKAGMLVDTSMIREQRWESTEKALNRLTIQDLVDRAESLSVDDLLTAITHPGQQSEFHLLLDLGPDGQYSVSKIDEYNSSLPSTCTQAIKQLGFLATFLLVVDQERSYLEGDLAYYTSQMEQLKLQVERLHSSLAKTGWFNSSDRIGRKLLGLANDLRELSDSQGECEAKLASLSLARRRIESEQEFLNSRLNDVESMLNEFVPRGRDEFTNGLVAVTPLDQAFEELLALTMRSVDEQKESLCAFAPIVLLAGLARSVGSRLTKVKDIANQIVFGENVLQSPPHGAVTRHGRVLKVYALPPIGDAYREKLRTDICRLDPEAIVTFNDSTANGICVIRYYFRGFAGIDQLNIGLNRRDYERVEESETGALRYPTGRSRKEDVERLLGIAVDVSPISESDLDEESFDDQEDTSPPHGAR